MFLGIADDTLPRLMQCWTLAIYRYLDGEIDRTIGGNRGSRFDSCIFEHFLMALENRVSKVTFGLAADDE